MANIFNCPFSCGQSINFEGKNATECVNCGAKVLKYQHSDVGAILSILWNKGCSLFEVAFGGVAEGTAAPAPALFAYRTKG